MRLYFVGVHHYDPLGRTRLLAALKKIQQTTSEVPAFIAIEYPKQAFIQVKDQRVTFETLLRNYFNDENFPGIRQEMVEEIVKSYGYEGDTNLQIFPDVQVLWLSSDATSDLKERPQITVEIMKSVLRPQSLEEYTHEDVLGSISKQFWRTVGGQPAQETSATRQTLGETKKLADVIIARAKKSPNGWAIVIVGASHCANLSGTAVDVVRTAGHETVVSVLEGL